MASTPDSCVIELWIQYNGPRARDMCTAYREKRTQFYTNDNIKKIREDLDQLNLAHGHHTQYELKWSNGMAQLSWLGTDMNSEEAEVYRFQVRTANERRQNVMASLNIANIQYRESGRLIPMSNLPKTPPSRSRSRAMETTPLVLSRQSQSSISTPSRNYNSTCPSILMSTSATLVVHSPINATLPRKPALGTMPPISSRTSTSSDIIRGRRPSEEAIPLTASRMSAFHPPIRRSSTASSIASSKPATPTAEPSHKSPTVPSADSPSIPAALPTRPASTRAERPNHTRTVSSPLVASSSSDPSVPQRSITESGMTHSSAPLSLANGSSKQGPSSTRPPNGFISNRAESSKVPPTAPPPSSLASADSANIASLPSSSSIVNRPPSSSDHSIPRDPRLPAPIITTASVMQVDSTPGPLSVTRMERIRARLISQNAGAFGHQCPPVCDSSRSVGASSPVEQRHDAAGQRMPPAERSLDGTSDSPTSAAAVESPQVSNEEHISSTSSPFDLFPDTGVKKTPAFPNAISNADTAGATAQVANTSSAQSSIASLKFQRKAATVPSGSRSRIPSVAIISDPRPHAHEGGRTSPSFVGNLTSTTALPTSPASVKSKPSGSGATPTVLNSTPTSPAAPSGSCIPVHDNAAVSPSSISDVGRPATAFSSPTSPTSPLLSLTSPTSKSPSAGSRVIVVTTQRILKPGQTASKSPTTSQALGNSTNPPKPASPVDITCNTSDMKRKRVVSDDGTNESVVSKKTVTRAAMKKSESATANSNAFSSREDQRTIAFLRDLADQANDERTAIQQELVRERFERTALQNQFNEEHQQRLDLQETLEKERSDHLEDSKALILERTNLKHLELELNTEHREKTRAEEALKDVRELATLKQKEATRQIEQTNAERARLQVALDVERQEKARLERLLEEARHRKEEDAHARMEVDEQRSRIESALEAEQHERVQLASLLENARQREEQERGARKCAEASLDCERGEREQAQELYEQERRERIRSQKMLEDMKRETGAPFVVPAMMEAFTRICHLTSDVDVDVTMC